MLRAVLVLTMLLACLLASRVVAAQESRSEPQEVINRPESRPAVRNDTVSQGYYAGYPAQGYYQGYVYWPNYPPKYPKCLGYGYGIRGHMLYHPRYIHGHPAGYLREHCPNDCKYGPVYYQSGMPVAGPRIEYLH